MSEQQGGANELEAVEVKSLKGKEKGKQKTNESAWQGKGL